MGTLSAFIPLLGIPLGYFLATLTPSETRHGKQAFLYLSSTLFAFIPALVFWKNPLIAFSLAVITFFILLSVPKPELTSALFLASTLPQTTIPLYLGSIFLGSLHEKRALLQTILLSLVFTIFSTILF